jgi:hypothetical protein
MILGFTVYNRAELIFLVHDVHDSLNNLFSLLFRFQTSRQISANHYAAPALFRKTGSGQQLHHRLSMHIGQAEVAALETIGQLGVVETEQAQYRRIPRV